MLWGKICCGLHATRSRLNRRKLFLVQTFVVENQRTFGFELHGESHLSGDGKARWPPETPLAVRLETGRTSVFFVDVNVHAAGGVR